MELRSAEVYDPISRRWRALPVMVTRRAYVGVACLNNCIYAVGGWNEALGALETVEKYCPEEVHLCKLYWACGGSLIYWNWYQFFHRLFTGKMGWSCPHVHSSGRSFSISSERVAVCGRGQSSEQRLLCPSYCGLCGDLWPSPGHLEWSGQHDHQPLRWRFGSAVTSQEQSKCERPQPVSPQTLYHSKSAPYETQTCDSVSNRLLDYHFRLRN